MQLCPSRHKSSTCFSLKALCWAAKMTDAVLRSGGAEADRAGTSRAVPCRAEGETSHAAFQRSAPEEWARRGVGMWPPGVEEG